MNTGYLAKFQHIVIDVKRAIHGGESSDELFHRVKELREEVLLSFEGWKQPPPGLTYAFEELDENFEFALEEFLNSYELVMDALHEQNEEHLLEAERTHRKAALLLRASMAELNARLDNWQARGKLKGQE